MPFFVALWVAVLHAVVGTSAIWVPDAFASIAAVRTEATVGRAEPRPVDATLRIARQVTGIGGAREEAPARHGPSATALSTTARLAHGAAFGTGRCTLALASSHAVSAHGDVLPYFATAPPRQG